MTTNSRVIRTHANHPFNLIRTIPREWMLPARHDTIVVDLTKKGTDEPMSNETKHPIPSLVVRDGICLAKSLFDDWAVLITEDGTVTGYANRMHIGDLEAAIKLWRKMPELPQGAEYVDDCEIRYVDTTIKLNDNGVTIHKNTSYLDGYSMMDVQDIANCIVALKDIDARRNAAKKAGE